MSQSRPRISGKSTKSDPSIIRRFTPARAAGSRSTPTPAPEILALQQRISDAVKRQHQLCAAKQACEAELNRLMKSRRSDADDAVMAERCGDKLEEMRGLAADAESAAAEIGRASGDLLIFQLRNGVRQH